MLIQGIVYCTVKYISTVFQKILQASRILTNLLQSKSGTPLLLFVGNMHYMVTIYK